MPDNRGGKKQSQMGFPAHHSPVRVQWPGKARNPKGSERTCRLWVFWKSGTSDDANAGRWVSKPPYVQGTGSSAWFLSLSSLAGSNVYLIPFYTVCQLKVTFSPLYCGYRVLPLVWSEIQLYLRGMTLSGSASLFLYPYPFPSCSNPQPSCLPGWSSPCPDSHCHSFIHWNA